MALIADLLDGPFTSEQVCIACPEAGDDGHGGGDCEVEEKSLHACCE